MSLTHRTVFNCVDSVFFRGDQKQQAERLAAYLTNVRGIPARFHKNHNLYEVKRIPPVRCGFINEYKNRADFERDYWAWFQSLSFPITYQEMQAICDKFDLNPHSIMLRAVEWDHQNHQQMIDAGFPVLEGEVERDVARLNCKRNADTQS